jgi:hypothetical protein
MLAFSLSRYPSMKSCPARLFFRQLAGGKVPGLLPHGG